MSSDVSQLEQGAELAANSCSTAETELNIFCSCCFHPPKNGRETGGPVLLCPVWVMQYFCRTFIYTVIFLEKLAWHDSDNLYTKTTDPIRSLGHSSIVLAVATH